MKRKDGAVEFYYTLWKECQHFSQQPLFSSGLLFKNQLSFPLLHPHLPFPRKGDFSFQITSMSRQALTQALCDCKIWYDMKANPTLASILVKTLFLLFTEICALNKLTCFRFAQKHLSYFRKINSSETSWVFHRPRRRDNCRKPRAFHKASSLRHERETAKCQHQHPTGFCKQVCTNPTMSNRFGTEF